MFLQVNNFQKVPFGHHFFEFFYAKPKDQLISKWCHRLDKDTNEIFSKISALASKKGSNQKIKALYHTN